MSLEILLAVSGLPSCTYTCTDWVALTDFDVTVVLREEVILVAVNGSLLQTSSACLPDYLPLLTILFLVHVLFASRWWFFFMFVMYLIILNLLVVLVVSVFDQTKRAMRSKTTICTQISQVSTNTLLLQYVNS